MKVKAIVALLGLSASIGVLAGPLLPNSPAPSVINPAPGAEANLQTIANSVFGPGHINVNTGQSSAGQWSSVSPDFASSIPTLVAEFTANAATQRFGIWFGTDTSAILPIDLLLGGATAHDAVGMTIDNVTHQLNVFAGSGCGTHFNCGTFTDARINADSFGFFFQASPASQIFYSLDQLNAPNPRTDRFVAFQDGVTTNWLFAYEDGTDFDYNDMAVKVESITAVPEPETYAMLLAGLGAMGFVARRRQSR
jgi:hypothetical protein